MDERTIRIITTGGTFDKQYDAVRGELIFRESQQKQIEKAKGQAGHDILDQIDIFPAETFRHEYSHENQKYDKERIFQRTVCLPVHGNGDIKVHAEHRSLPVEVVHIHLVHGPGGFESVIGDLPVGRQERTRETR